MTLSSSLSRSQLLRSDPAVIPAACGFEDEAIAMAFLPKSIAQGFLLRVAVYPRLETGTPASLSI